MIVEGLGRPSATTLHDHGRSPPERSPPDARRLKLAARDLAVQRSPLPR